MRGGKPGAVLHTLTNPVIDGSKDTAEDFTSSGYELAANTTYSVSIYQPSDSGHFAFLDTESTLEDTETQLGWTNRRPIYVFVERGRGLD